MEPNPSGPRLGWALALAFVAAPLLLVAGSWSQITAGGAGRQAAEASAPSATAQAPDPGPSGPGASPLRHPRGYVALTYDDGPNEEFTPRLLDILEDYDAPATFFVQGDHSHEHPELVERELEAGHVVGNHTYDHMDLTATDPAQVRRQLLGTNEALAEIGFRPELYRPPYDRHDAGVDAIAADLGLTRASWTYRNDPKDWDDPSGTGKPAGAICSGVVAQAQPDDVILLHDRFEGTIQATPCLIRGLRERDLEPGRLTVADRPSAKNGDSMIKVVP